jgi:transcriptional regulator
MYLRPAFVETNPARIAGLIRDNPFGLLVTTGPGGMEASHIPFIMEPAGEEFTLLGHLAASNPQCAALDGGTALAVFGGPHAYVSPSWYRTQPAVPTWDFCAAHVSGRLETLTDTAEIEAGLQALAAMDPGGFTLAALPEGFRTRMVQGIRAFRLIPAKVEGQWKMSQNRSREDRLGVIDALRRQEDPTAAAVAELIEETLPPLHAASSGEF